MTTNTHPSIARYNSARRVLDNYPVNADGGKMTLEHVKAPELGAGGIVGGSSFIDDNPETVDILRGATDQKKGSYNYETCVEVPPKKNFWGTPKGNRKLMHIAGQVQHVAGGYNLANAALTTVDLVTGEEVSKSVGKDAVKGAQKLEKDIPYRIFNIDPIGQVREEENWLIS